MRLTFGSEKIISYLETSEIWALAQSSAIEGGKDVPLLFRGV